MGDPAFDENVRLVVSGVEAVVAVVAVDGGTEFRLGCQEPIAAALVGSEGKTDPTGTEDAFAVEDDDRLVVWKRGESGSVR